MVATRVRRNKPSFLWVHYYAPHHDYMPHPDGPPASASDAARYDHEILVTDRHIGELVDYVETSSTRYPIVWIVTADHGEGLGDHGIKYHNNNFYKELCHAPLVIKAPGARHRRIEGPVSLHDIGPTVMNLARIEPDPRYEGRSLGDSMVVGREHLDRAVFHQAVYSQRGVKHEMFGVTTQHWRYFWDRLNNTRELYNLDDDPLEQVNLVMAEPDVAERMMTLLDGWLYRVEQ